MEAVTLGGLLGINNLLPPPAAILLNRAGGLGKPCGLKHVFLLSGHALAVTPVTFQKSLGQEEQ